MLPRKPVPEKTATSISRAAGLARLLAQLSFHRIGLRQNQHLRPTAQRTAEGLLTVMTAAIEVISAGDAHRLDARCDFSLPANSYAIRFGPLTRLRSEQE